MLAFREQQVVDMARAANGGPFPPPGSFYARVWQDALKAAQAAGCWRCRLMLEAVRSDTEFSLHWLVKQFGHPEV